jgi:hypothetical protein
MKIENGKEVEKKTSFLQHELIVFEQRVEPQIHSEKKDLEDMFSLKAETKAIEIVGDKVESVTETALNEKIDSYLDESPESLPTETGKRPRVESKDSVKKGKRHKVHHHVYGWT